MECQSIIELLSPYLDGELEPSEAKFVGKHLEHCPRCRKEMLALQEISFVLQELPEITPSPDFHEGLQAKLAKLTTAAEAETIKQKVSPIQKFVYGTWSKVAAFAAVLILALGITALWDPEGLVIKIKPVQESNNVLSEIPQSRQQVSIETKTLEKQDNIKPDLSDITVEADGTQYVAKNNPAVNQKESTQNNYTPAKYEETQIIASELPEETSAMKIQSEPERSGNEDIPEIPPVVTRAKEPAVYDRVRPFAAGLDPNMTAGKTEETGQEEQFFEQGQESPKFIKMHLDVEDIENAIAEILILIQNNNAAAEVQQNNVLIVVPAEYFVPLSEQIQSLGQVTVKEYNYQADMEQELSDEQNSPEQEIYTIYLELK
ncbi:anti-sigma factor family protein [Desulfolucanica intricata]|uniref:anti-sigma factor family protein n=1 Tax=Desulfolucanica intricata TaxID=1285191 RepID=UPI000831C34C|nr:zf-HC2 domain-containing protein [Desulfolucanica intricata]